MKQLLLFGLIIFTLSSCSRKVYFQDAVPSNETSYYIENSDIHINTYYAGDAVDYIIFEIDVTNKSQEDIYLDHKDVVLRLMDDRGQPMPSLSRTLLIDDVYTKRQQLKQQRRSRNIEAALGIGLGVLTAVTFGNPAATFDAILYSIDSAAYAFEGNRSYALLAGSLDEQLDYINTLVLDATKIPPGDEQSWDVLFEPEIMDNACQLQLECMGQTFTFDYDLFVGEMKVR